MKVLDLFAGTQSVRKALEKMNIEFDYTGIDVYSPEGSNMILDLSSDFSLEMLLDRLGDWKPDIIWASPVCNRFSNGITGKGGNAYFIIDETQPHGIRPRLRGETDGVFERFKPFVDDGTYASRAEEALRMHIQMMRIIDHFNVPFAIENPASAMTRYVYKNYKRSICNYCAYGFTFKKRTAIYSSQELKLKMCPHPPEHKHEGIQDPKWSQPKNKEAYAHKSRVPENLIVDIFSQIIGNYK